MSRIRWHWCYGWLAGVLLSLACHAEEAPFLQLDPGGHMALINDIAFTPDGRYLISAGDDKVIRLWEVASGLTARTLRGQIGPGSEGQIYAMALSPDGRWLAVGGWMAAYRGDNQQEVSAIRLYEVASGAIVAQLKGHSNIVVALAFSPDGRYLLSGSLDKSAMLWEVAGRRRLHTLSGHQEAVYAVAFTADSQRAVTGAEDGELRLWQVADGGQLARLTGHKGAVEAVAVAPKGGLIASGSSDHTIRLWEDRTGGYLKTLAEQGTQIGSLSFSPDGQYLLTGVGRGTNTHCQVYRLADGKRMVSYTGHDNAVVATAISPDGRLAATAGGSSQEIHLWSLTTGALEKKMAGVGTSVWAVGFSADGQWLAWGNVPRPAKGGGQAPLTYQLRLPSGTEPLGVPQKITTAQRFVRARTEYGKWRLQDRAGPDGADAAVLDIRQGNRVVASIQRGEQDGYRHRAYTFTPDGGTIISAGSNGVLSAYDPAGRKLGDFNGHTSDIWAVAVSPDGKLLASASADQTVRLWDVAHRELLVSLFYGSDGEWVAWTPSGYYIASPRGDRYVGWHQNRGPGQAADYYPVAQFRVQRYRPEVVSDALLLRSETEALARWQQIRPSQNPQNAAALIAQVPAAPRLAQGPQGSVDNPQQTLVVAVDERTERLVVNLNGRPLPEQRGLSRVQSNQRLITQAITLDPGANQILLLARNASGDSPAVSLTVNYQATNPPPDKQPDWSKPSLYLLAIGVSEYADPALNLGFAAADARALVERLSREAGGNKGLYREVHSRVLTDREATRANVLGALELLNQMAQGDLAILFVAGHGIQDQRGNFYYLPHDGNAEQLLSSGIKWLDFKDFTSNLPGKVILLADTCHAGGIYGERGRRAVLDMTYLAREFADAGSGVVVFASSQGKEFSEEHPDWSHGAFTRALLDGLAGKADLTPDGVIYQSELEAFVKRAVVDLTQGRQHPVTIRPDAMADFALALPR